MQTFVMNGFQIMNARDFRVHFSPADLLRNVKSAACFAVQGLAYLSAWDRCNADMLFGCAFNWENVFERPLEHPRDYFDSSLFRGVTKGVREMLETMEEEADIGEFLMNLWHMAVKIDAGGEEQSRIFCILAAGYFLARKTWADCPIGPKAAMDAYRGKDARRSAEQSGGWYIIPADGVIPASNTVYKVRRKTTLEEGERLELRRICAGPHPWGNTDTPVRLKIYRGEEDPAPETVEIRQNDYRYGIFAGGELAGIHPIQAARNGWVVAREGGSLVVSKPEEPPQRISLQREAASIAVDGQSGWLLLYADGTIDSAEYPLANNTFAAWNLPRKVLELAFDENHSVWVLDPNGCAECENGTKFGNPVLTLAQDQPWRRIIK